MNRTHAAVNKLAEQVRSQPGVEMTMVITGYDFLDGATKSNSAAFFTGLAPWSERKAQELSVQSQIQSVFMKGAHFPEGTVLSFNPPALPGLGTVGGFTLMLEDKTGGSIEGLDSISKQFMAAARQRPEIGMIYSTFRADTPGYRFNVDREKAEKLGVPVSDVFSTLQTFLGGLQVNDFNRFGRTYKVTMQAEPKFRNDIDSTRFLFLKSSNGTMVPLNTLVIPEPLNAPPTIKRFNAARAIQINGSPAPGYSSGQALTALEEVAAQTITYRFFLCVGWAEPRRKNIRWQSPNRIWPCIIVRLLMLGGIIRELEYPLCRAALRTNGHLWCIPVPICAQPGKQCVHANRLGFADRLGC